MLNNKRIRAVIFDLDGTLLDTAPDFVAVLNQLLAEHSRPQLEDTIIRAAVSNGSRALIQLAFEIEFDHPDFETLRERLLELYIPHIAVHTRLFPGVQELLNQLDAENIVWGIATNKPSLYTHLLLEQLQIHPAPVSIICPEDVKERKPHAESLLLASQHVGCSPEQLVFVGDHKRDIDCGKNAGAITIAAAYGYIETHDDINLWQADYCVNHASEIWPILSKLLASAE